MRVGAEEISRRAEQVRGWLAACRLCPWACGVDRTAGERGVCGLGDDASWYRELLHVGEERELVPSHVIYLSGCTLRCAYCSEGAWVLDPCDAPGARPLDPADLARRIATRRAEGARNVNFVGGAPDASLLGVLRTLALCPRDTTVVWNANLWTAPEVMDVLDGVVDIYVPDLKFGNDACAEQLAVGKSYGAVVGRNLRAAARQDARLIVRHLVLPEHLDCCTRPTLAWVARNLPEATVNLMTVFYPFDRMGRSEAALDRRLSAEEKAAAVGLLRASPLARKLLDGEPF